MRRPASRALMTADLVAPARPSVDDVCRPGAQARRGAGRCRSDRGRRRCLATGFHRLCRTDRGPAARHADSGTRRGPAVAAQRRAGLRRRAYARRVRRRSRRRAAPAAGWGLVRRDRGSRRRHRVDRRGDPGSLRIGVDRGGDGAPRRDAGERHDHLRNQERLRPDDRVRAETAARDRRCRPEARRSRSVATFMGAHEVPLEYRNRRAEYVDLVVDEMLPAVARQDVARWCDVFCEEGVFTPAESTRILRAGRPRACSARIHADELGSTGGSQVAAAVGARSADHSDLRLEPRHLCPGRCERRGDAPADRRLLPEAGPVRAGAAADRGRGTRSRSRPTSTREPGSRRACRSPSRWPASRWG